MATGLETVGIICARSLLIKDSIQSPGSFLIAQLLHSSLRQGGKVLLVLAKESTAHYQHVLRRLGTNLKQCVSSDQLQIIDCLDPETAETGSLAELWKAISYKIHSAGCQTIIVDSISELRSLFLEAPTNLWMAFLIRLLLTTNLHKGDPNVIGLVHADVFSDLQWIQLLEHHAEVVVELQELHSGRTNEITGQVTVSRRHRCLTDSAGIAPVKKHLYKLGDMGMRIIFDATPS